MSKVSGVVKAFDDTAFVSTVGVSTKSLNEASLSGNKAQVISSIAAMAAAFPGPQQVGAALVNFGLSPLPVGASYAATGEVTPSQVLGIALAGASLVVAGAAAAGITAVAGVPMAVVGGTVALASVTNELFPNLANDFYDKASDMFVSVASGEALENAIDGFGSWFLDNIALPLSNGLNGILQDVSDFFQNAHDFIQRIDPLALDIDGDGIETASADTGITFDFDGDAGIGRSGFDPASPSTSTATA